MSDTDHAPRHKLVVYEGPGGAFVVDRHTLKRGEEVRVPAKLGNELLKGSDRTQGHTFSAPAEEGNSASGR